MPKNLKIIILLILFVGLSSLKASGGGPQWFKLMKQHRFSELQKQLKQSAPADSEIPEYRFCKALFLKDGEQARAIYENLYKTTQGRVRFYAARKLMDYYYAKGYYVNAADYQKYIVEHRPKEVAPGRLKAAPQTEYFIQVGAFSLRDNALQRKEFLAVQNIQSTVIERKVNGKTLFCVWIPGQNSVDETLTLANRIKQKYALNFQIMKK